MMEDYVKIKNEAIRRGITRLCHFTQSRKLAHVLTTVREILSTEKLTKEFPDILDVTDKFRRDGYKNHICCTIEYPNTWYWRSVKDKDLLFKDWVVVLLNPAILWRSSTLFCPTNAATQSGSLVSPGYAGFMRLFQLEVTGARRRVQRRTGQMLPCCPTDDQAEVLVRHSIPIKDILGIAVPTEAQARRENIRLSFLASAVTVKWIAAPQFFNTEWSALVRQGQRPKETPYVEEIEE